MRLDGFDAAPEAEALAALAGCCSSAEWARRVAAGRPYGTVDAVVAAADSALAGLDEGQIDAALAAHPRIGERSEHASSQREQATVASAAADVLDALAAGNRAYEQRFGHVYLVCADGRPAAELLAVLHERLGHEPAEERRVVRAELGRINALRLRRLLADA